MGDEYSHSGAAPVPGLLLAAGMGLAAALTLGFLYSLAVVHTISALLNPFLTLIFGGILGLTVFLGARLGKIRNSTAACAIGTVVGAIGLYFAWAAHQAATLPHIGLTLSPVYVSNYMSHLAEDGSWSVFGSTPTGLILGVSWLAEATFLIGIPALLSSVLLNRLVFCESCGKWAKCETDVKRISARGLDPILRGVRERDLAVLRRGIPANPHEDYVRLDLTKCGACPNGTFLSMVVVEKKKGMLGGLKLDETHVVSNQPIRGAQIAHVREAGTGRQTGTKGFWETTS